MNNIVTLKVNNTNYPDLLLIQHWTEFSNNGMTDILLQLLKYNQLISK